jgi:LysM repeat protein
MPNMKLEHTCACIFLSLSLLRLPVLGQDAAAPRAAATPASTAAVVAEQQGFDEKFKQLAADMDTLRAANQLLVEKVAALKDELAQVRAEQARQTAGAVGRDELKPLELKIEAVDKKRQEDKDAISEQIKNIIPTLQKVLTPAVDPSPRTPVHPVVPAVPPAPQTAATDGVTYTIKDGDRLRDIVIAYNNDLKKKGLKTISSQQVMDANPGVDWKRLKIGQKIVIPIPAQ